MRTHQRIASLSWFLLVLVAAVPLAASTPPEANDAKTVTVMTRNLYLGADVAPVVAVLTDPDATPEMIIAAVSEFWAKVRFTNFPARAEEIAREVAEVKPDLIGLQEAELWRSQTPADFVMGNADHVEYDFVQILLDALAARGLHYAVAAQEQGLDIELPAFLSEEAEELSEIRLTEREVILARADLTTSELKLSNAQTGHFATNIEFPDLGFVVLRGWASVDAKVRGKDFRFVTTHLEADDEGVREAQAAEIISGPADTSLPVVFVADANSNANGGGDPTSPAYDSLINAGFVDAWFEIDPAHVSSCCADELLLSSELPIASDNEGRIDLVLFRGAHDFNTLGVSLFGNTASDKVFNGVTLIWPSDHAGVAAKLQIHN
jgi:endonuclease/exonuclease/phosphatase family metal-dependent hydrolase